MTNQATPSQPMSIPSAEPVHYPLPLRIGLGLIWSMLLGRQRSFGQDARTGISLLKAHFHVLGSEMIPQQGPCLVTANHYAHPGFKAWWITLAISASLPFELHWVMTDAWRFDGHRGSSQLEALSRGLFQRIARIYGFTSMPSMPPRETETHRRAEAVLHLLGYARRHNCPAIGLVPEGYDMQGGVLGMPPPGVGRLIAHLLPYTQRILPAAVYEDQGNLFLRFGESYIPEIPTHSSAEMIDRITSETIMRAIALLLPSHLRGEYH